MSDAEGGREGKEGEGEEGGGGVRRRRWEGGRGRVSNTYSIIPSPTHAVPVY